MLEATGHSIQTTSKDEIITWIIAANQCLHSQTEMVKKAFLVCGISNNLDGSENHHHLRYHMAKNMKMRSLLPARKLGQVMTKTAITCSDSVYQFITFSMRTVLLDIILFDLNLLCFFFILAGYELNKNRCINGLKLVLPYYCSGSL